MDYIVDKKFDQLQPAAFVTGDYEACEFANCDLANADLSKSSFLDCTFIACNLSSAKLVQTALKNVRFGDCKLLGMRFDQCSDFLFEVGFTNCTLNFSSFYGKKLKKTVFKNSEVREVDFTGCDLEQAIFDQCDLFKALFENTRLLKADLRTSFNYAMDPETNELKNAKFSLAGVAGLLGKYGIEIE